MDEEIVLGPDDYCNDCGNSDVPLTVVQNGRVICDDCSYKELQNELEEYQLIKNARERVGRQ